MSIPRPWRTFPKWLDRRLNGRRQPPIRFDEFREWLASAQEQTQRVFVSTANFHNFIQTVGPRDFPAERWAIGEIQKAKGGKVGFQLQDAPSLAFAKVDWPTEIDVLHYEIPGKPEPDLPLELTVERKNFQRVHIQSAHPIKLTGCFIRELIIERHGNGGARVTAVDCYVQTIRFFSNACDDLHIEGGALLGVTAPVSFQGELNPFCGRVTVERLYIPRDMLEYMDSPTKHDLDKIIYEMRNIRTLLAAKNDVITAGLFHSVELALERQKEPLWNRIISYVYEAGCDYGNSITRPIKWLFAVAVLMGCLVYAFDAVEVGESHLVGWRADLASLPLLRAVVYPFWSIFNPLNIIDKSLLITKAWQLSVLFTAMSLVGTTALAFMLLALRRRFKLE